MKSTTGTMKTIQKNNIQMLQFEGLAGDCNIFHFITTRHGGVSEGRYASFNLGAYCGDRPDHVQENRKRLCDVLSIDASSLFVPHQTHGTEIRIIDESLLSGNKETQANALEGIDALITAVPGVCIAVTTADCVPLILYDPKKQVVAAIHAGWRGTVNGITTKTVKEMTRLFDVDPGDILAGIAPSIGQKAFEVGQEVVNAFSSAGIDTASICYHNEKSGKPHIDLVEVNRQQLIESGINPRHIEQSDMCTHTLNTDFYSARQLSIHSGRFLTGILLTPKTTL